MIQNHPSASAALVTSIGATAVSFLPLVDILFRIGASFVAILSGILAGLYYIRKLRREK